jgi:hypothetical protein
MDARSFRMDARTPGVHANRGPGYRETDPGACFIFVCYLLTNKKIHNA